MAAHAPVVADQPPADLGFPRTDLLRRMNLQCEGFEFCPEVTAKAGVVFAIARQLARPIHFIGIGEGVDDLKPFLPEDFVDALLARDADL